MKGRASRRALFGSAAALVMVPTAQGIAAAASPSPDAELIHAYREYIVALDAYAACSNSGGPAADPLWQYIEPIEGQIEALEATTMAGVAALAEVAQHWARQPDGMMNFNTSFTGDWPEFVVLAVLRIAGGQA